MSGFFVETKMRNVSKSHISYLQCKKYEAMLNKSNKIKSLSKKRYFSLNNFEKEIFKAKAPISRIFCVACNRSKHLFKTEKEAKLYIEYNGDTIKSQSGYKPVRVYWCMYCCGYHTTSKNVVETKKFNMDKKRKTLLQYKNK